MGPGPQNDRRRSGLSRKGCPSSTARPADAPDGLLPDCGRTAARLRTDRPAGRDRRLDQAGRRRRQARASAGRMLASRVSRADHGDQPAKRKHALEASNRRSEDDQDGSLNRPGARGMVTGRTPRRPAPQTIGNASLCLTRRNHPTAEIVCKARDLTLHFNSAFQLNRRTYRRRTSARPSKNRRKIRCSRPPHRSTLHRFLHRSTPWRR